MGPKQYLLLRRMHLARQTLCSVDPNTTIVTDLATQYGFRQSVRFVDEYSFLFYKSPSLTLRRQSKRRERQPDADMLSGAGIRFSDRSS